LIGGLRLLFVLALVPVAWLAAAAGRTPQNDRAERGRVIRKLRARGAAFDRLSATLTAREAERDRAERDRRAGEAQLARLLALTPAGVVELDAVGRIAYANAAAERILGAPPGGLLGRRYDDPAWQPAAHDGAPIPPDRLPVAWALRGEAIVDYEHAAIALDGRRVVLLVDIVPVRGENGRVEGALAAFQDVTARQAAAQALGESELRFRSFVENSRDVLWIIDAEEKRLEYLSPSYEQVWCTPREHIMQDLASWAATVHPDDRARTQESLPRLLAGETHGIEYRIVRPDGDVRWMRDTGFPIPGTDGRIRRVGGIAQDVTEQKAAEHRLAASEARFRHMADSAPALIWMTDAQGQAVFANMHFDHLFGRPAAEMLGEGWKDVVLADDLGSFCTTVADALCSHQPFRTEMRVRDKDGQARWMRCDGVPRLDDAGTFLGYTGCAVDITEARLATDALEARVAERTAALTQAVDALHTEALEREEAEAALRQSQKMEAVGQLTGGIAHDFNNMLQAIGGSLELMRRRISQGRADEAEQFVDAARQTVGRAAALTNRLLAFARRQALQPRNVEPDTLIEGMAELIRRTTGSSITVELRKHDGIWTVLCDPNQLENVLLNLAINARDAMPEGGRLIIGTSDVRLSEADVAGHEGASPGDYVEISVTDTGTGMDEATRARAFEPFFTTKPLGQGTGLGLSQLYGFVRQSDGVVRLDSAPGRGTTVRLYLPRHELVQGRQEHPAARAEPSSAGAGETVLLVEDEEGVRAVAAEHLREFGYTVLEATDGPEALGLLRSSRRVDMLVTDVGLPGGLNGRQVADAARERRPGLPVLFITGFAGAVLDGQLAPGMEVIGKPFALNALAVKVRTMLEAEPVK
jgi:PAS domain S-box-containing protein